MQSYYCSQNSFRGPDNWLVYFLTIIVKCCISLYVISLPTPIRVPSYPLDGTRIFERWNF